jgi:hypothetical protein
MMYISINKQEEFLFGEILFGLNEWVIFVIVIALFLCGSEIGFRLGWRAQSKSSEPTRSQVNMLQAASLGLLALLLGFTFSMALTRFDTRKQLVLNEANAIGTTYLRAQLLPDSARKEVSNLLNRYVNVRLEFYQAGIRQKRIQKVDEETEKLHSALWSHAIAAERQDPRAIATGLFIQSLNEVVDLHARRVAAMENHVPESIFILLLVVATLSLGQVGYGAGIGRDRNLLPTLISVILIASVILLIMDLDRPRRGLIKVSQQSMVDLQTSLKRISP